MVNFRKSRFKFEICLLSLLLAPHSINSTQSSLDPDDLYDTWLSFGHIFGIFIFRQIKWTFRCSGKDQKETSAGSFSQAGGGQRGLGEATIANKNHNALEFRTSSTFKPCWPGPIFWGSCELGQSYQTYQAYPSNSMQCPKLILLIPSLSCS